MIGDNNLLTQIEQWDISTSLNIQNISEHELSEAQDKFARLHLSSKQRAVVNDILGMRTQQNVKNQYHLSAPKYYAEYIKNLINIGSNNTEDDFDLIDNINASFIRSYIHRDFDPDTWNQTISSVYDFILQYKCGQNIILNDTIIYFLLLVKDDKQFQEVLSIYYNELSRRNDYNLLEWIFDKNKHHPPSNTGQLFNTYKGTNNLKNIIPNAQTRIGNSDKLDSLKALARDSFLSHYDNIYKANNYFCLPIPDWINNILTDRDKNTLKDYYKNMKPSCSEAENFNIRLDQQSTDILEQIKNSNSLEEIINFIISMNTDEFIANNMHIFDSLTGARMLIISPIKSLTGEVYYKDADRIKQSRLNCLYEKMFDTIPKLLLQQEVLTNLIKNWNIVDPQFYQRLACYLTSILHSDIARWQREANINQIVLLVEPILGSLDPHGYTKFSSNNKNGCAELVGLKGKEYKEFINSLLKHNNSDEKQFLLGVFGDHRNKVAHGKTFQSFGNCYFILVGIMKVLCMSRSDFNLSQA